QLVGRARLRRDPVALGNAVAVEPEDEPRLDRRRGSLGGCGVRGAVGIEHGGERWQADANCRAGHAHVPEKPSSAERHVLSPGRPEGPPLLAFPASYSTESPASRPPWPWRTWAVGHSTPSRNCGERTSATSSSFNLNPESRNAASAVLIVSRSAGVSKRPNA